MLNRVWDFLVEWAEVLEKSQQARARRYVRNHSWIE